MVKLKVSESLATVAVLVYFLLCQFYALCNCRQARLDGTNMTCVARAVHVMKNGLRLPALNVFHGYDCRRGFKAFFQILQHFLSRIHNNRQ